MPHHSICIAIIRLFVMSQGNLTLQYVLHVYFYSMVTITMLNTIQYSTQSCELQSDVVQHNTLQCSSAQFNIAQCSSASFFMLLRRLPNICQLKILYSTKLFNQLCCTTLYTYSASMICSDVFQHQYWNNSSVIRSKLS